MNDQYALTPSVLSQLLNHRRSPLNISLKDLKTNLDAGNHSADLVGVNRLQFLNVQQWLRGGSFARLKIARLKMLDRGTAHKIYNEFSQLDGAARGIRTPPRHYE